MIAFTHVAKTYGARSVLNDVSFALQPREWVTIEGGSGSGKTAIVRLLLRAEDPTKGSIEVDGVALKTLPLPILQLYRRRVGVIFQEAPFLLHHTVADNVALGLDIQSVPAQERDRAVADILGRLGLTAYTNALPATLSRGQRSLISIARALVTRPMVIVADEPLQHLDPEQARTVLDLLHESHKQGASVLFLTVDPALANVLPGRKLLLSKGMIAAQAASTGTMHATPPHHLLDHAADTAEEHAPITGKKIRITAINS